MSNISMYTAVLPVLFMYLWFLFNKRFNARKDKKITLPTDWPLLGMLPAVLVNCNRIHDWAAESMKVAGGTFLVKGPWFSRMDSMVTADPANVHYILSKNFQNYRKGPEFEKIFDVLGDGIFIAEDEHWENQRKTAMTLIKHNNFQNFAATISWEKIEKGLIPILDLAAEFGTYVDLQDLFKRFAFDATCIQVIGHDPGSLTMDLPYLPHEKAFADAEEAILLRHVFPESTWKLQKQLRIGKEHKLARAKDTMHDFLRNVISLKQNVWRTDQGQDDLDLLIGFMRTFPGISEETHHSLKHIMINFIFAGKDTISAGLTWFFYLMATHPEKLKKIRQEIVANLTMDECGKWKFTKIDEVKPLCYLHGAVCETLRLYPPVGLQHKAPAECDTLPSGHIVKANTRTLLSFYAMARLESIWGEDCCEFKPERWISPVTGRPITVPSFKFPAFNAGPRSCLGKEMSLIQMKIVAAAILSRFDFQVDKGPPAKPSTSAIMHMRHGLEVKVSRCVIHIK